MEACYLLPMEEGRGTEGSESAVLSLRVAVIGAGPAGLYVTEELLRHGALVDVFEKSFAPHGTVRSQVAPDHQNIKRDAELPDHVFQQGRARFFGNVEVGRDLELSLLRTSYDAVILCTGGQVSRPMDLPGATLAGSISASDFIGWYNGEPRNVGLAPRLDGERAVVVGMGPVALDIARVLVRHPSELEPTDITPHALSALKKSRIREVVLLGQHGPDQATFGPGELGELQDLVGVQLGVAGISPELRVQVATDQGERLSDLPAQSQLGPQRRLVFRFCSSPVELLPDADEPEHVGALRYELNELGLAQDATAQGGGQTEELATTLVVWATGFQADAFSGVPFSREQGVIPNRDGRVLEGPAGKPALGLYVTGSIAGDPSTLESNRARARQTVARLIEDLPLRTRRRLAFDPIVELDQRGVRFVSWTDWLRLDQHEMEQGHALGKVRQKLLSVGAALEELGDERSSVRHSALSDPEAIAPQAPGWPENYVG